jgi:two-component system phosphate regulon sensor histidine kinase PhoR
VRSAAETLRRAFETQPEVAFDFLEIIERNAERLHSLIEDLLDLSRIESKDFALQLEDVQLAGAAQATLAMFGDRAAAKGIRLSTVVDEAIRVRADWRALDQVLTNLVDNAVKYCPERANIAVRAELDDDLVRLRVEDDGPGIEARHLSRIFERFYRVDAGRSREVGGTGLGLSIVKHLCEAMKGRITVESRPGKGTCFEVVLPRA